MNARNYYKHVLLISLMFGAVHAHADTKGCIELKNEVQMEQEYTDDKGQKNTRLVPPAKVIPGNEVIYTIVAKNTCDKSIDHVVINNPVPEHMSYVANSAMGVGTDITYSINGKDFGKADALSVKDNDGKSRSAHANEIGSIRWVYANTFEAGATGFVRFRAVIK